MKKNILLLVEKKGLIEPLMQTEMYSKFIDENNVKIAYFYGFGLWKFSYPSHIKYAQYPITKDVVLKPMDKNDFAKQFTSSDSQSLINSYQETINILNESFDEIIIIADNDHCGAYYANYCLEYFKNDWKKTFFMKWNFITFNSIYDIEENFKIQIIDKNTQTIENMKKNFFELLNIGEIKKYFEYNYNLNSQVFFKEILKSLNINKNITLTKYMVLVLHLIKNKKNIIITKLFQLMLDYKGTKKYRNYINENGGFSIGSPTSRKKIIENLELLRLIEIKNEIVNISELGKNFLNLLSKKSFDPDIHNRISSLCELNKAIAFHKIDTYIKNMFNPQKRKNKYLHNIERKL